MSLATEQTPVQLPTCTESSSTTSSSSSSSSSSSTLSSPENTLHKSSAPSLRVKGDQSGDVVDGPPLRPLGGSHQPSPAPSPCPSPQATTIGRFQVFPFRSCSAGLLEQAVLHILNLKPCFSAILLCFVLGYHQS